MPLWISEVSGESLSLQCFGRWRHQFPEGLWGCSLVKLRMIEGTRRSFASSRSHTEPDPLLLQTGYAGALRKMCSEVKFVRIIETKTLLPEAIWYFGFHCLSGDASTIGIWRGNPYFTLLK